MNRKSNKSNSFFFYTKFKLKIPVRNLFESNKLTTAAAAFGRVDPDRRGRVHGVVSLWYFHQLPIERNKILNFAMKNLSWKIKPSKYPLRHRTLRFIEVDRDSGRGPVAVFNATRYDRYKTDGDRNGPPRYRGRGNVVHNSARLFICDAK